MIDLHNGDIEEHLLTIEILSVIDLHNGDVEEHLLTIENVISDRSAQWRYRRTLANYRKYYQ